MENQYHCTDTFINKENSKRMYIIETPNKQRLVKDTEQVKQKFGDSLYQNLIATITDVNVDNLFIVDSDTILYFEEPISKITPQLIRFINSRTKLEDKRLHFKTVDGDKLNNYKMKADIFGSQLEHFYNMLIIIDSNNVTVVSQYKFVMCNTNKFIKLFSNVRLQELDMTNVMFDYTQDFTSMFSGLSVSNLILDLSKATNVKRTQDMFKGLRTLQPILKINMDLTKCECAYSMFAGAFIKCIDFGDTKIDKKLPLLFDNFNGNIDTNNKILLDLYSNRLL